MLIGFALLVGGFFALRWVYDRWPLYRIGKAEALLATDGCGDWEHARPPGAGFGLALRWRSGAAWPGHKGTVSAVAGDAVGACVNAFRDQCAALRMVGVQRVFEANRLATEQAAADKTAPPKALSTEAWPAFVKTELAPLCSPSGPWKHYFEALAPSTVQRSREACGCGP